MGNILIENSFVDSIQIEDTGAVDLDKADMKVKVKDKFIDWLMFWFSILQFHA